MTTYDHDVRGRVLLQTNPAAPHSFHAYDNLGRRIETGQFSATTNIVLGTDTPVDEDSNRLSLSETKYDEMGRAWKTVRHKIETNGTSSDTLTSETWYDAEGRVVKREGSSLTKTRYDGLGRSTHRFVLAFAANASGAVETSYSDALDVDDDIVLQESQTAYDPTSGLVLMRVSIDRHHDDKDTGETTGELDKDGDALKVTASNLKGRAQITAMWYDTLDRVVDTVRYGTNGGSNFDRGHASMDSPPIRSDDELRSTYTYGIDGGLQNVEDPLGRISRTERDGAGRTVTIIRNCDDPDTPGAPSGTDDNVTVRYEYTDGLRTKLIADLPGSSDDQETVYTYGTEEGTDPGDSKIATLHLLQKVQYPDSAGGTDVVTFAYDAQSSQIWKKDQAGNVLETTLDEFGRRTSLSATTIASGFNATVKRIDSSYNTLGQLVSVVQYNATSGGGATDGVTIAYDGWGNLTSYEEDRDSAVTSGGDQYKISYTWEKGELGRNTVRKKTATLPSGAILTYDYRATAGRHDGDVSRVTSITHDNTLIASYQYNGVGRVVDTVYNEIDVMSRQYGTAGTYPDLDRFNRVASSRWTKDLSADVDFYAIDLAYDRNSNITLIEDQVHVGLTGLGLFDVQYTMDDVDRLTKADEGNWTGSVIDNNKRDQVWTLDQVGNWDTNKLDLNGDGSLTGKGELDETRVHNDVNEITSRTPTPGGPSLTYTYDAVGNMTADGAREYEYDPFGRLRKVKRLFSPPLVAAYRYNGLGHRIAEHVDTDDDGDVDSSDDWRYFAYDERWRITAHFLNSGTVPTEEFVHHTAGLDGRGGSSYIDLVVMRERDDAGSLDERMYYCQNWRADVSAIVDDAGEMYEWAKYSAYGVPYGLPGGDTDSDGDCDAADILQIRSWILASAYDVRGDVDLDGDVDATDKSIATSRLLGVSLARDVLSGVGNRRGYAGYRYSEGVEFYHVRNRVLSPRGGRWLRRDALGYVDGLSLYEYTSSRPTTFLDPSGLQSFPQGPPQVSTNTVGVGVVVCIWTTTVQMYIYTWQEKKFVMDPAKVAACKASATAQERRDEKQCEGSGKLEIGIGAFGLAAGGAHLGGEILVGLFVASNPVAWGVGAAVGVVGLLGGGVSLYFGVKGSNPENVASCKASVRLAGETRRGACETNKNNGFWRYKRFYGTDRETETSLECYFGVSAEGTCGGPFGGVSCGRAWVAESAGANTGARASQF